MTYFVTGATGFIGKHLVERLLRREGQVYVLVRESSRGRLETLLERWGGGDRVVPVVGDLGSRNLGISDADLATLTGSVDHFFHLAAVYDMTADEAANRLANVDGTRHAVELANAIGAGCLHLASSIAVAGEHKGLFREDMFDEGQKLPSPYHQTKYESEKIVREKATVPWRVYRPAVVVGHSVTGEMDKVDGPYYFFKAIQKARHMLPEWVPLAGPELGWTNIVPVDFVADAMDHIAHVPGLDGQAFHLTAPKSMRAGEVINAFAAAGHAPQLSLRVDKKILDMLPKGVFSMLLKLPAISGIKDNVLHDLGIPPGVLEHIDLKPIFDTRDTERALEGSDISVPELSTYADVLWDYWERTLNPDLYKDRSLAHALRGRTVVITGASSGIGRETALKVAAAGGVPLLVARGEEKLLVLKTEIEEAGGSAYVYPTDLTDLDAIQGLCDKLVADHPSIDFLVNNAGRSIRRSLALSYDRFHDFERTMQLNYFGTIKLIMGLMPHMTAKKSGHIVNISSIGVQTGPPRFAAYVASKAALDAFTKIAASETLGRNVTFTTIHMPLVRTPMIAPTKIYDNFPTISPEEAADMICEAMRSKPKTINTRLGTAGEIGHAIAPKAMDQILHMAYKVFPDSTAAKGEKGEGEPSKPSNEAVALAHLMKGVHF